jgi:hypothetical protein
MTKFERLLLFLLFAIPMGLSLMFYNAGWNPCWTSHKLLLCDSD